MNKKIIILLLFVFVLLGIGFWYIATENDKLKEKTSPKLVGQKMKKNETGLESMNTLTDNSDLTKQNNNQENDSIASNQNKETKATNSDNQKTKKDEASLTFCLMSFVDRKPIANQSLEIRYSMEKEKVVIEKYKTDANGCFQLLFPNLVHLDFVLQVEGFAFISQSIWVCKGENKKEIFLNNGGTLIIKALDSNNQIVKNLECYFYDKNWALERPSKLNSIKSKFDVNKGVYLLNDLPLGRNTLWFKAPHFYVTNNYIINISEIDNSPLEIKLNEPRQLFFILKGIDKLPKEIFVRTLFINNSDHFFLEHLHSNLLDNGKFKCELSGQLKINDEINAYESFDNNLNIFVKGYLPILLKLDTNKTEYELNPVKGFSFKVKIMKEDKTPISGAEICYLKSSLSYPTIQSDINGNAELSGLPETCELIVIVTHKQYKGNQLEWTYNQAEQKDLIIVLKENQQLMGIIKNINAPTPGVTIRLFSDDQENYCQTQIADKEGKFQFSGLYKDEYTLKASHLDYGVAETHIKLNEMPMNDLILVLQKEKSLSGILIDENDQPLANKNIIFYGEGDDELQPINFATDSGGEFVIYNQAHGSYVAHLEDDKYYLKNNSKIMIPEPNEKLQLIADLENVKKVIFYLPGGQPYIGNVKGFAKWLSYSYPIKVTPFGANGFSFDGSKVSYENFVVFEIEGYSRVVLGLEKDEDENDILEVTKEIPEEIKIELKEGNTYFFSVKELKNLTPISKATIEIFYKKCSILKGKADLNGSLSINHLDDSFTLKIEEPGFAIFKKTYNNAKGRDIAINLIQGGSIKGLYPLTPNDVKPKIYLSLLEDENFIESCDINSEGKFEFSHLNPGKYEIELRLDYFEQTDNKLKITIEDEKETEVILEAYKKK